MTRITAPAAADRLPTDAPRWVTRVRLLTVTWALAYGALRLWWVVTGSRPVVPPLGDDLIIAAGGGSVVLCLAAAALALALGRLPATPLPRRTLWAAAWVVSVLLAMAGCMAILDLVGALFPGVGIPVHAGALLSRTATLACAVLLGTATLLMQRVQRGACPACGRRLSAQSGDAVHASQRGQTAHASQAAATGAPRWAVAAAYAAVVACLVRLGAQAAVGFDVEGMASLPQADGVARFGPLLFLVCIVAAGTVLPLALVHGWGRTFPRWMPVLAGRTVPRWVLLGPAFLVAAGLVTYFGAGVVLLAGEVLGVTSVATAGSLPPVFFWVAVPAYVVWGLGLGAAALSYFDRTRPACRRCDQAGPRRSSACSPERADGTPLRQEDTTT